MIHEWDNHIAEEQKPLAGTGMCDIGKLVRGNAELLGKNLSISLRLIEHIDKVAVFKNVLDLTGSQKVLDILREP